ncbi:MAG: inorganic pyrophosphatase [Saprospiraceae bacterium]|jgi:inorganic pyrophosphatase|nr:inorganic pyrophosphatase [Saprospiraceae bacterium]MBP9195589.1 inorganic pyrophosphatase [Saprospiraceae bacterium]
MKPNVFSDFKAHPWHGVSPGSLLPKEVVAFIEISSTDTVKYEIDKPSGYLRIDRPQKYSNVVPALYGFIPRTYCGNQIAALCMEATGIGNIKGDGDPLDILVLTEKVIPRGDILVDAIPIGGLRLLDKDEADDKIIAVLKGDQLYGHFTDIHELPEAIINRLTHYFVTYKQLPEAPKTVEVMAVYGQDTAFEVILAGLADYKELVKET